MLYATLPALQPPLQAFGKLTTLATLKLDDNQLRAVYTTEPANIPQNWTADVIAPLATLTLLHTIQLPRMQRDPAVLAFGCESFPALTSLRLSLPRSAASLGLETTARLEVGS